MTRRLLLPFAAALVFAGSARAAPVQVVAAENMWGSIATQLAGDRAQVTSIITSPATDPHAYEPRPSDARLAAGAQLAIVNGIGYDTWASKLLDASPSSGRIVLDVGDLLGLSDGDNPHQWYDPTSVRRVVAAITADLTQLDPADAAYFRSRRTQFLNHDLATYDQLRAEIRRRFAGVPVGYSESIFAPLGQSLGLDLATPASFAKAIAEGTDVSAGDEAAVEAQARKRKIAVWVYNSQNATPDVATINAIARAHRIPIVTVTETLSPATVTFESWQVAQLRRLIAALHQATGR